MYHQLSRVLTLALVASVLPLFGQVTVERGGARRSVRHCARTSHCRWRLSGVRRRWAAWASFAIARQDVRQFSVNGDVLTIRQQSRYGTAPASSRSSFSRGCVRLPLMTWFRMQPAYRDRWRD
jgi:hypothetical protein